MRKYKPIPGECESCPSYSKCEGKLAEGSLCGEIEDKPTLDLTKIDGNAFALIGTARKTLRKAGYSDEQLEQFKKEATSGDYDNVIQTIMKWCEVI
jgi:hypothetical protein